MRTDTSTLYLNIVFLMICAATVLAFKMSSIYAIGIIALSFTSILVIILKRDFLGIDAKSIVSNNLLIFLMLIYLFHGLIINGPFVVDESSFLTWSLLIISNALIFILAYNITKEETTLEKFLFILFLFGTALTFLLLYLVFRNFSVANIIMSFSDNIALSSKGIGSKKNIYGSLLMFTVVPTYYLARERKRKLLWVIFILQVFALVVVFARSVWIAVLVSFIVYSLLNKGKSRLIKYCFIWFLVVLLFLILLFIVNEKLNLKMNNNRVLSVLFSDRNTLWAAAIRAARANPLGYGISNDQKALIPFTKGVQYVVGKDPHNTFLRYLVSNGYFGLIIYVLIAMVPFIMMKLKSANKIGIMLLSMHCGMLAYQFTEVVLLGGYSFKSYLYTLFFYLTSIHLNRRKDHIEARI